MDLKQVLDAGDIDGAIQQTAARVKKSPTDAAARYLLAELHSVNADWMRVDKHLELIHRQEEKLVPQVTIFRQLLRAAKSREECFEQGRVPMFQQEPTPVIELHLKALIAMREKQHGEAKELLDQVELTRQHVTGNVDDHAFDDLRDLDDLTSSFMELMTATGEYYWVPIESLLHVELTPPQRLRDLLWRPARVVSTNGPVGNVYIPGLYHGSQTHQDPFIRLGKKTDWLDGEGGPIRGIGQRMWLFGDQVLTIQQLTEIMVTASPGTAE